jgi:hypothetical protein
VGGVRPLRHFVPPPPPGEERCLRHFVPTFLPPEGGVPRRGGGGRTGLTRNALGLVFPPFA